MLIWVGRAIGLGQLLLLLLIGAALGTLWLRRSAGPAWRAFRTDVDAQRPPGNSAVDGLLVIAGGVLLILPGLLSDLVGLIFIIPATRRAVRGITLGRFTTHMSPSAATSLFGPRRVRVRYGRPNPPETTVQGPPQPPPGDGVPSGRADTPIEGEIIEPDR